MKDLYVSFLCLAALAGGVHLPAQGNIRPDSIPQPHAAGKLDSIQNIREVVIVGSPVIPKYREVIPAQVLKDADLQRLNSLSVADAIRYFAGVQLKDYGGVGGLKTVNIRSMGTNHMAVFYDGIQLGNAQNGQVDLGHLCRRVFSASRKGPLRTRRAVRAGRLPEICPQAPRRGRNGGPRQKKQNQFRQDMRPITLL